MTTKTNKPIVYGLTAVILSFSLSKLHIRVKLSKFSELSFCHFFIRTHSRICYMYPHCIGKVSTMLAQSKAVVGIDQPMKSLSMYIQKLYLKKLSKSSQLVNFSIQLIHAYVKWAYICIGQVSTMTTQSKDVVGVDWHMKALSRLYKALFGKKCLCSHGSYFVIFFIQTHSCMRSMCLR